MDVYTHYVEIVFYLQYLQFLIDLGVILLKQQIGQDQIHLKLNKYIYIYAKSNGKWYGKNNKNNKIFDISKNYPAVAKNLDAKVVVKKAESNEVPQPPQLPTTPPPITSNDNAIQPPQEK